jgi:xylulokinase
MAIILGIDLGTQSVKSSLLDTQKGVIQTEAKAYEIKVPKPRYAEQDPEEWWEATKYVLAKLKASCEKEFGAIEAIGLTGQMHGLVALDKSYKPVIPAIIWLDQRSEKQVAEIEERIPFSEIASVIHNRIFTGFAFPSLLWLKENEPAVYSKIYKICCPKDYIRMKLTGEIACEVTDASSTTIFDVPKRDWYFDAIDKFGLGRDKFPKCYESTEVAGRISASVSAETGLAKGTKVVYGSGDQSAHSIGNGAYHSGVLICNIGTGGVIATYSKHDVFDKQLRIHSFCNAIDNSYVVFGAMLAGGLSLNWLKNKVLDIEEYSDVSSLAADVTAGSEGLIYLPYLCGERTPHMNAGATGMLFGLKYLHDRKYLSRAVMEGVSFALKDSVLVLEEVGIKADRIIASGGGAKSEVWLQIQADIFDKEIQVISTEEQATLGACIIAGLGTGIFNSTKEACNRFVKFEDRVYCPDRKNVNKYNELFEIYQSLYQRNKDLMTL